MRIRASGPCSDSPGNVSTTGWRKVSPIASSAFPGSCALCSDKAIGVDSARAIGCGCAAAMRCRSWKPYLQLIARHYTHALNILDRFHVVAKMNLALDDVRAAEARRMAQDGYEPVLKQSRWCLLKRPENLTDKQRITLRELLRYNLASIRAYLLKAQFQGFWGYDSPTWAGKFLDQWCTQVMRSRIEPM